MDFLKTLLEHQPLMTLFLTIAIGYFVGEINIKGFSLGVGAVLFVALQDYVSSMTTNWMFFVGLTFVLVVLFFPRGLMGMLQKKADA